jgi:hypothetical protein
MCIVCISDCPLTVPLTPLPVSVSCFIPSHCTSDCPLTVPLTPLPVSVSCFIPSHCTSVDYSYN